MRTSCAPMAVEAIYETQKLVLVDKIVARVGPDLSDRAFAIWGLAFKPSMDDMREAPSRTIIAAEWREFESPDFVRLRDQLALQLVFDGRNLYEPRTVASLGLEYHCIGRPTAPLRRDDFVRLN